MVVGSSPIVAEPSALDTPMDTTLPAKETPPAHRAHPRKTTGDAWTAWRADDSLSSAAEFLQCVASWTEGTAAQLLRPRWPSGIDRPTTADVEARLRQNLELAAHGDDGTYVQALAWARSRVLEELRSAREGVPVVHHHRSAPG